jgi:hypothetical protein
MGRTLAVGGITDGAQILFDRVAYTPGGDAVLTVRAKPMAGGTLQAYASWGLKVWTDPAWTFLLAEMEISVPVGEWMEFSVVAPKEAVDEVTYGRAYYPHGLDLMFRFLAAEGVAPGSELFEISEFGFSR